MVLPSPCHQSEAGEAEGVSDDEGGVYPGQSNQHLSAGQAWGGRKQLCPQNRPLSQAMAAETHQACQDMQRKKAKNAKCPSVGCQPPHRVKDAAPLEAVH